MLRDRIHEKNNERLDIPGRADKLVDHLSDLGSPKIGGTAMAERISLSLLVSEAQEKYVAGM